MYNVFVCVYLVKCVGGDGDFCVEVVVVVYFIFEQVGYCGEINMWVWVYVDFVVDQQFGWFYLIKEDEGVDYMVFG